MNTLSLPSAELVQAARRLTRAKECKARHVRRGLLALARGHLAQARICAAQGYMTEAFEEMRLATSLRKSAKASA